MPMQGFVAGLAAICSGCVGHACPLLLTVIPLSHSRPRPSPAGLNNAADVAASKAAGELVPTPKPVTIADGLEARLGDLT